MRILILGGAGFAGQHHVNAALSRGHAVTVFSRKKCEGLDERVEVITGDRYADLDRIRDREWDAVVDVAAFAPLGVRTLAQVLKASIKHYTLISTVMTYVRASGSVDESSAVLEYTDGVDPYTVQRASGENKWIQYGCLKVLCEREAQAQFPGRTLIVRPGVLVGPGDYIDHIGYWFARMARGGEVLAPGDPLAPVQFIDARDLAEWVICMVERSESGVYNAVGPSLPMTMSELLGAVRSQFSTPVKLTWVPSDWLIDQKLTTDEVPFFWMKHPETASPRELWVNYAVSCKRAHAKGLRFRSLDETLSDNLTWFKSLPAHRQATSPSGWPAEIESKLLMAWHASRRRSI